MEKLQYFCDSCKKECQSNEGLMTFAGFLIKMTPDLKAQKLSVIEHYCRECSELILRFIEEMKNESGTADNRNKHDK